MPGYPDSHLGDSRGPASLRRILVLAPIVIAVLWIGFYWFTTRVFPISELWPDGKVKFAGYVRRTGIESYKRHGHWIFNHPNGRKAAEGYYELGEKTGEWRYWDAAGKPTSQPALPDL